MYPILFAADDTPRIGCRSRAWACALALLTVATDAWAVRLDQVAVHYSQLNDAGNVGIADVTISIATESSPRLLTYLGNNIHYDITLGRFFDGDQDGSHSTFVYAGPTWQYQPGFLWQGGFLEFGTAVTYLIHANVGERNLGGHWQFTTHATLGHAFGTTRRWRLGLRLQHTSNAGIENPNPGLDAALVEVAYRFQ